MPLHALPSDVATVIHDFCGTRELGYSLGCCSKAWRPTDAVWKRLASRHPLTRLAVKYVSSKYAGWCAALYSAQRPNEMARPLAYAFDEEHGSSVDPAPHYVVQIWRGGTLVAVQQLVVKQDIVDNWVSPPEILFQAFSGAMEVEIDPDQSLRFCIVAIPHLEAHDFEPTLLYFSFEDARSINHAYRWFQGLARHRENEGPTRSVLSLPQIKDGETVGCHGGTMGSYNEVALSVTHQTRETLYPQCIVRVLHDAGELTSLQIVEFAWHFPNLFQQHIKLNPRSTATIRG